MAIKGLTDQTASFPRIGELRKGEEKPKEGNRPGKDLTYFRFTSDDGLARQMFTEAYPDQEALRNIHVFMPHKTADENMEAWIEKWVAGGLVYRSDGETIVLWRTDKGSYSLEPKPDPYTELDANGKRKDNAQQVGRMSVIVPELGRFATVTILTTSKHDIMNLTRQLRSYEALRGDLRGIPFVVKRRAYKISTPGQNGKRERREKWLLSIETQPQWAMAQLGMMERAALPGGATIELQSNDFAQIPANIPEPMEIDSIDAPPWYDEPENEVQQEPIKVNGKLHRPLTPEQVKNSMGVKSQAKGNGPSTEQQLDYAASSLSKACGGDETKRHTVTMFLFGKESMKALTGGECSAIIDWVGAKADTDYEPNGFTVKEIEAIVTEYQRQQGQIDMFTPVDVYAPPPPVVYP